MGMMAQNRVVDTDVAEVAMNTMVKHELDTYLDRIIQRADEMRRLNLAADGDVQHALAESQHLLAVLAMYRHALKHAVPVAEY